MNKGKYVLSLITTCLGLFVNSCENKAPEINYSVKYEHKTDFTGIISAINNGSLTLAQALAKVGDDLTAKIDLLAAIIEDQTVITAQKIEAVNLAIKMNTDALNDQTEAVKAQAALFRAAFDAGIMSLKDAIGLCGSNLSARLGAIHAAIESQTASQAQIMNALKAAIDSVSQQIKVQGEAGRKSIEALGVLIESAINSQTTDLKTILDKVNTTLDEKATAIAAVITNGNKDIITVLRSMILQDETLMTALNKAVTDGNASISSSIQMLDGNVSAQLALIKNAINTNLVAAINGVKTIIESTSATQKQKLEALKVAIEGVTAQLGTNASTNKQALEALGNVIKNAINSETTTLSGILNTINSTISDKATTIASVINTGDTNIVSELANLIAQDNTLMTALTTAVSNGSTSIKDAVGALSNNVTAQTTLLVNALNTNSGYIVDKLEAVKDVIANASATQADKLDVINAAIGAVTTQLGTNAETNKRALEALGTVIKNAINSETTTLWGILNAINSTISDKATTIASVINSGDANIVSELANLIAQDNTLMTALTTAVSNGSTSIKDAVGALSNNLTAQTTLLVNALNANSGDVVDALEAVETVIANASGNQAAKLDLINAAIGAVTTQLGTNATSNQQALVALGNVIKTAVDSQTTDLHGILTSLSGNVSAQTTALVAALNGNGSSSIVSKLGELLTSNQGLLVGLTNAVTNGLVDVTKAIQAFEANDGMWRENNGTELYMKPAIWAAISDDGTMTAALIEQMTVTDMTPTYTSNQAGLGHSTCTYEFTRIDQKGKVLIPTWDNENVIVNNENQETVRIICIYEKQKWEIKSTGCSLYWNRYKITDAKRTNQEYGVPAENRVDVGNQAYEKNLSVIVLVYSDEGGVKKLNLSPHFDIIMKKDSAPDSYPDADPTPW
ncbi:MAG: hypothetical protein PUD83_07870 [Bacteroidales bacterium]|nr:hypothetical protein [Bacteroidales bacterium]